MCPDSKCRSKRAADNAYSWKFGASPRPCWMRFRKHPVSFWSFREASFAFTSTWLGVFKDLKKFNCGTCLPHQQRCGHDYLSVFFWLIDVCFSSQFCNGSLIFIINYYLLWGLFTLKSAYQFVRLCWVVWSRIGI